MSSSDFSSASAMGAGRAAIGVSMTTTAANEAAIRNERANAGVAGDARVCEGGGRGMAIVVVAILAIVAATIAAFATREGPGLTPDSRGYLLVAEQIHLGHGVTMLDGDGKKVPLTHCPPLYPVMLWAGDALLPGNPDAAARMMGIALFALNVALIGLIAWRLSGRSATAAILAAGLMAFGLDILLVHSMVWTEPMFILSTFAALYFIGRFLDSGRRGLLVISAIFAALSFGTRYAGASLILTCGLLLMFGSERRTWGRRIVDAFIHGAISCGAMFVWLARNAQNTRDADGHAFAVHLPNRSDVKNALVTVAGWVVPGQPGDTTPMVVIVGMMAFGLVVVLGVGMLLVMTARNARRVRAGSIVDASASDATASTGESSGLRRAIVWFLPVYIGFVLVSVSFFDAHVPLDRRILSPVHVVLMVLIATAVAAGGWSAKARRAGVIAISLLIALHAARAFQWAAGAPNNRHLGYATREWRSSPTMAAVAALPNDMTIFTNGVDAIYLRAHRFARPLPKVTDPTKAARDPKFRKYMNGLRDYLDAQGGYIVYFNNIPRAYMVPADQLAAEMKLELIQQLPDGAIYRRLPAATTKPAP